MNDRDQLVDIIRHALDRLEITHTDEEAEEIAEIIADEIISTGWPRT